MAHAKEGAGGHGLPVVGSRLQVRVRVNRSKTALVCVQNNTAFIDIAAPAQDNKANIALLKFLQRATGQPCSLLQGASSKTKLVSFG